MPGRRGEAGRWISAGLLLLAGSASVALSHHQALGSFSLCQAATDSAGNPRPECQASDIRFEIDPAGPVSPASTDFGFSIAAGNLNGDGFDDLVVGDPLRNRVYVFFGRQGAPAAYGLDPLVLADRAVSAEALADVILLRDPAVPNQVGAFGFSVAVGREASAAACLPDGAAPLLIGAPGAPGTTPNAPGTVFYVPPGGLCMAPVDPPVPMVLDPASLGQAFVAPDPEPDDEFGYSVGFGRLLTSTGTEEDVVVGARGALAGAGRVTIFPVSGGAVGLAAGGVVKIEGLAGEGLGEVLAVGDLDLDFNAMTNPFGGTDDLAVGAVGHPNGKVVLAQGPLSPTGGSGLDGDFQEGLDAQIRPITGEASGDFFGFSVAVSGRGRLAAGAVFADNVPGGDTRTNVNTGQRVNGGKAYLWNPGVIATVGSGAAASSANLVLVARRSGDHLGFAVAFGDLDASQTDDLIVTARREDGSGLKVNEIDHGTAYVVLDSTLSPTPADLSLCAANSDCTGVAGVDVMVFGGDRESSLGDEAGFAAAVGDFNGDAFDDLFLSSRTHKRVYLATIEDTDDDRAVEGRNIRDNNDDGDADTDDVDCAPADPAIHSGANEIACNDVDENCNGAADDAPDADGDGFDTCGAPGSPADCDDDDDTSFPGGTEVCDGNDNDCAGTPRIPSPELDTDGDRFVECSGWLDTQGDQAAILGGDDCNDLNSSAFPGAAPLNSPAGCLEDRDGDDWGDAAPPAGITAGTDCNDDAPDGAVTFPGAAQVEAPSACMKDADDDGYGDAAAPPGVSDGTDCNDADPASRPGAAEACDGNDNACAGAIPAGERDPDGDLWAACSPWNDSQGDDLTILGGGDCDNADPDAFPGASPNEAVPGACTRDADDDGWGDLSPPAGVTAGTDCDDDSADGPFTFPGAAEIEAPLNCMKDADGDGYGDDSAALPVVAGSDCEDADPAVFAGAPEIADDGTDQDCNGADTVTCFTDGDGDGAGVAPSVLDADGDCADSGQAPAADDCNDGNGSIHPGAAEIADDGIDQDCNGADTVTCVLDADEDGAGTILGTTVLAPDGTCDAADGEATTATDCDDGDPASHPGAAEACDGNDNDCAGGVPASETDTDGDFWVPCSGWSDTQGDDPTILGGGDCDDTHAATFPGAAPNEPFGAACMRDADGDDWGDLTPPAGVVKGNDCDDDSAVTFPGAAQIEAPLNCMKDADDDGYGAAGTALPVVAGTDCDDDDPASFPGASEACDGNDNDCSGGVPAAEIDADGDLWVSCSMWDDTQGDDPLILGGGDCDDAHSGTFPGAAPNESVPDLCMRDADGDDWGDLTPPAGVTAGSDCDDDSADGPFTFPGAAEIEAPLNCMKDADDDGYGDAGAALPVVAGTDCDDGNPLEFPGQTWYADCDGDGAFRGTAVLACDQAAADAGTPCLDALPPDGGWTNTDPAGSADADDEDGGIQFGDSSAGPSVLRVSVTREEVSWLLAGGPASANVYRGDLETLRTTGRYTQAPGENLAATRFCGQVSAPLADPFLPEPGRAAFYLVTAAGPAGETSLGTDSRGVERLNSNPCP